MSGADDPSYEDPEEAQRQEDEHWREVMDAFFYYEQVAG